MRSSIGFSVRELECTDARRDCSSNLVKGWHRRCTCRSGAERACSSLRALAAAPLRVSISASAAERAMGSGWPTSASLTTRCGAVGWMELRSCSSRLQRTASLSFPLSHQMAIRLATWLMKAKSADCIIYDKAIGLVLVSCADEGVLVTIKADVDPKTGSIDGQ
jgi:hypothetical protein